MTELAEMSFDQVVKACVEKDLDGIVKGTPLYNRVYGIAELVARWRFEKSQQDARAQQSSKNKIYVVNEVEPSTRYITGQSHGFFSNFAAAEAYVKTTYTPNYNRYMMILETDLREVWSPKSVPSNVITYYRQIEGNMVKEIE